MKSNTFTHILITLQLCSMCVGLWLLIEGVVFWGIFNIVIHASVLPLNIKELK